MKLVRLSPKIDSEYAGDPEFGEPKTIQYALPTGGFATQTVYVVKPGKDYKISDGHAEELRQTWGWRQVIREA